MFNRLRNRLLVINMSIISIVVITAFGIIYFITNANIQEENQAKLESIPKLPSIVLGSSEFYDPQSGQVERRVVFPRLPIEYSQSFITLINEDGETIDVFSYIDMPEEAYHQIVAKARQTGDPQGSVSFDNRTWKYATSSFEDRMLVREHNGQHEIIDHSGYMQISFLDITDSRNTLNRLLLTFVLVGLAVICSIFGVSLYFANRSIRPIEESWHKQKQFVADASHELKTPLAIITANTDALLADGNETINSQKKWIDYIQSETSRMSKLVNDMLYLAKVEDSNELQVPFDLSGIVSDVTASLEAIVFEKGVHLTQNIESDIFVKGDSENIKRVVLILLDNAIKYVNDKGNIHIELKKLRNTAVFSVQNSGEGIPEDKLPRIFDRFYRIDPSRSQETGGYGLGLSIAKALVERSGGSIYAESADNSTTFTFELKLI
ncbi:MAG: HAMP domain-containing histidine kinase [Firmicutes bacterium]|nr:HAMP domain-containing histidine kinase [Bacillota bacterium]